MYGTGAQTYCKCAVYMPFMQQHGNYASIPHVHLRGEGTGIVMVRELESIADVCQEQLMTIDFGEQNEKAVTLDLGYANI